MSGISGCLGQANSKASLHIDGFKGEAGSTRWRNKEGEPVMDVAIHHFSEQVNSFPLALNLQAPPTGFLTHVPTSRNSPEVT